MNIMCENDFSSVYPDVEFNGYELCQILLTDSSYLLNLVLRDIIHIEDLDMNILLQLGKRCVDMGHKNLFHDVMKIITGTQRSDLITHTLMVNNLYLLGISLGINDMPVFPPTLDMIKEHTGHNDEVLMVDWLYSMHWTGEVGKYLFKRVGMPKHKEDLVNKVRSWYLKDDIGAIDSNIDLEQLLRLMDKEYYKKMVNYQALKYVKYDTDYIWYTSRYGKKLKITSCPCNLQALIYLEDGPSPTSGKSDICLLLLRYTRLDTLKILLKGGKMTGLEPNINGKLNLFSYTFLIKNCDVSTSWKFHMNDRDLVQLFLANNKNVKLDREDIAILPYCAFDLFPHKIIEKYISTDEYSTLVRRSLRGGNTLPFIFLYKHMKYDESLLIKYKRDILISGCVSLMKKIKWEDSDFEGAVDDLRPSSIEMNKRILGSLNIRLLSNAFLRNDVFMVEYLYENDVLPMNFEDVVEIGEDTPAVRKYLNYGGKVNN
jgi:hypothetical protein